MVKKKADQVIVKESPTMFARRIGMSKSHVTKLKQDDRLVTEVKGKRWVVLVEESLARIKETEDPNRQDVAQRHAKARDAKEDPEKIEDPDLAAQSLSYQKSRAKNEHFKALQQEAEYKKFIGELVEVAAVKKIGADLGAYLRTSLENMADQMSAELAVIKDPALVHSAMIEHVEHVLNEISRELKSGFGGE